MATDIRPLDEVDIDDVVELSVAAWAPVFASIERQLAGSGVYEVLHPDWAAGQRRAVETACRDPKTHVWVATVDGEVAGFVAVVVHLDVSVGEIHMLAVDPAHQRHGVGRELTEESLRWMTERGLSIGMVETGGDPGHAPARRTYEAAGFHPLPLQRYFKRL